MFIKPAFLVRDCGDGIIGRDVMYTRRTRMAKCTHGQESVCGGSVFDKRCKRWGVYGHLYGFKGQEPVIWCLRCQDHIADCCVPIVELLKIRKELK